MNNKQMTHYDLVAENKGVDLGEINAGNHDDALMDNYLNTEFQNNMEVDAAQAQFLRDRESFGSCKQVLNELGINKRIDCVNWVKQDGVQALGPLDIPIEAGHKGDKQVVGQGDIGDLNNNQNKQSNDGRDLIVNQYGPSLSLETHVLGQAPNGTVNVISNDGKGGRSVEVDYAGGPALENTSDGSSRALHLVEISGSDCVENHGPHEVEVNDEDHEQENDAEDTIGEKSSSVEKPSFISSFNGEE
ncbi:glycosyl transferase family 28 [Sesbania bispinosa]|nr:glycosyl transferase family 28 [Sesbania bispinosa]